ncbi:PilX N-terminal domain-containing pilus assembly protein [Geobacter sp.]|uniref:PilX N-terminal domain-containing pilus assembly protein n=1 Tax=Geobacter sp. TaxID=46610 RepID=UPI001AD22189|nr:PilX N-terminal domain-containing pilus assembly protein [Geobacter sp.]CAG0941324.1 hypothetical protein ANRL1_00498 [Anaerolineae bacterium]
MTPTAPTQSADPRTPLRNERGAALLIVLVMLLLLTILGATLFTSSTTEIKIAGNFRNTLETFFAADAAVEYAMTDAAIYTSIIPDSSTTSRTIEDYTIPGTTNKADIQVNLISARNNPPPGHGYQEDAGVGAGAEPSFRVNVFAISVEAEGPNEAKADIEAGMARVVPH